MTATMLVASIVSPLLRHTGRPSPMIKSDRNHQEKERVGRTIRRAKPYLINSVGCMFALKIERMSSFAIPLQQCEMLMALANQQKIWSGL